MIDNERTSVDEFEAYKISPPSKDEGCDTSKTQPLFMLNVLLACSYTVNKLNEVSKTFIVVQAGLTSKG